MYVVKVAEEVEVIEVTAGVPVLSGQRREHVRIVIVIVVVDLLTLLTWIEDNNVVSSVLCTIFNNAVT